MIWRRISSIDVVNGVCSGSCSPSRSQRTFVLRMARFRRCEALVPHDVFIASPIQSFHLTYARQNLPSNDLYLPVDVGSLLPILTNRSSANTARRRSVTF